MADGGLPARTEQRLLRRLAAGGRARPQPAAITATAGTVSVEPGNDKGFWLQGPDDGLAFAATVTVPVTVDLSGYDDKFGWCGNATDRPPYVTEESGSYALHGAAPFILQTIPGDPAGTVSEATKAYAGCIYGLTDATNCPVESIPPMPSVSGFTASATTLCAGQSATLTATAANAQRYSFDDGATWQAGATKVVTPTTTTTYILKATRALGACTVSYATPVTITVHPSPELQFDNPPAALCANTDAVLTVNDLNSAAGSYCFRYECAGCVHNPYRSGNSAPAAAGCDWFPDCTYGAANTYSLSMYDAGSMTVWAKAKTDYGCVDSVATTINEARPGKAGEPVHPLCGCEAPLKNCGGTCGTGEFTACNGIVELTCAPYDAQVNRVDAEGACTHLGAGWRVARREDYQCMCANKSVLPGGFITGEVSGYYLPGPEKPHGDMGYTGYDAYWFEFCIIKTLYRLHKAYVKCVR